MADDGWSLPGDWKSVLREEGRAPYFQGLETYVAAERSRGRVFPAPSDVFAALAHTSYEKTRLVVLGQDPYHGLGQAHGLAFSVRPGVAPPPSLSNIFRELHEDVKLDTPSHGSLFAWADQGVLLLNTVLTVREGEANSHKNQGWEHFTDAVLRALDAREKPMVFLLWGRAAQKKAAFLDTKRHAVLQAAHPSPLSAHSGFFGSRPFSRINTQLAAWGQAPIDWRLPPPGPTP